MAWNMLQNTFWSNDFGIWTFDTVKLSSTLNTSNNMLVIVTSRFNLDTSVWSSEVIFRSVYLRTQSHEQNGKLLSHMRSARRVRALWLYLMSCLSGREKIPFSRVVSFLGNDTRSLPASLPLPLPSTGNSESARHCAFFTHTCIIFKRVIRDQTSTRYFSSNSERFRFDRKAPDGHNLSLHSTPPSVISRCTLPICAPMGRDVHMI